MIVQTVYIIFSFHAFIVLFFIFLSFFFIIFFFSTNCDVSKEPCVFDISVDPCEYNNLAPSNPDIVKKLMERLMDYNATAVPPRNKPADPKGLPSQHGGVWVPWISDEL